LARVEKLEAKYGKDVMYQWAYAKLAEGEVSVLTVIKK